MQLGICGSIRSVTMDAVTVLITGVGAPGTKGTMYSLEKNFDQRKIKTVGVDIRECVVGKYLCDKFYQVPRPINNNFIPTLLEICEKEQVDVVLPQVTAELEKLARYAPEFEKEGVHIAVSTKKCIKLANNKHELMKRSTAIGIPTPSFRLVNNFDQLEKCIETLGYPKKPVVIKPPISHGMIGFRIIDESEDKRRAFFNNKPEGIRIRKEELKFLGDAFPKLLIMEYLPGPEYTIDVLSKEKEAMVVVPRRRDFIRTGITFEATVEKDERIIDYSKKLTERIGLEYAHGFQFKCDENGVPKIIECNPRIQGTMVLSTLAGANIIYGAVKLALGEKIPEFNLKWGTKLLRYWGGIGVFNEGLVDEI